MSTEIILALVTLILLEVVLGIDNIIFLSILTGKLPKEQQKRARRIGIFLAMFMRLALLAAISWVMALKSDLFELMGEGISGKDLILIVGGLFLMYKSTIEIYHKMEGEEGDQAQNVAKMAFSAVIAQVVIMDLVFSLDSIITAVGLARDLWVMFTAVIISVIIMLVAAEPVAEFVDRHPAFKILALSFLLLIGFTLVSEGFEVEIPKGYIYFSMAFSFGVNLLQMRFSNKSKKTVKLHEHYKKDNEELPENMDMGL
jgi:predicted tellurium resistance membrane protein TerC